MKKRLILILNGKGGVGKSFFAVHFVQYLKDHQIAHAAFVMDAELLDLAPFASNSSLSFDYVVKSKTLLWADPKTHSIYG